MKLSAFFSMLLIAANGMRVQQRRVSSSAGNETTKCTFNPQALADCESPAVRQKCGSECTTLCDKITEDQCFKSSTTIKEMCKVKCAEIVAKTPKGGKAGTRKCDMIEILDQCKGPFKLACEEKCQGLLDKAEAQTCVDLQTRGEPTRVSLTRLLGLTDTEAAKVLSMQEEVSMIDKWEQVETFLSKDLRFKSLLAKMDKAKICKPAGEHVDELESPTTLAGTAIMNEEPSCVDINGDETMLRRVRGIGAGRAQFILALKEENGADWEDWSEFQQQVDAKIAEYLGARNTDSFQLATAIKTLVMEKCNVFCKMKGKQPFPCSK